MFEFLTLQRPAPTSWTSWNLFAPLIGHWDLQVRNIDPDGTVSVVDGEWWFS